MKRTATAAAAAILSLAFAGLSHAGPSEAQRCLSAKLKIISKYDLCLMKSEAIAALLGMTADTSLCDGKLAAAWSKPDDKYGLDCPQAGAAAIASEGDDHVADILALLDGGTAVECGNGTVEGIEECDGADLGGGTCQSYGFDGGTLSCDGECQHDTSACTSACDVLVQDCPSGQGCYYAGSSNVCAGAGDNAEGESCTFANDCQPGYVCAQQDATTTCHKICRDGGGEPSCDGGQFCFGAPEMGENAGICF